MRKAFIPIRQRVPAYVPRGFSLIELMIGMAIGLLCTIVIATVLSSAEANRRGTTSGSDAQVAGGVGLYTVQRDIASSGYGFASELNAVGCLLDARYNGVAVGQLPPRLAPVFITKGAGDQPDQIRVIASTKGIDPDRNAYIGFTVPLRVEKAGATVGVPGYSPGDQKYHVASVIGVAQGDLMVAVPEPAVPPAPEKTCEVFEVNQAVGAAAGTREIPRVDDAARWNAPGFPSNIATPSVPNGKGGYTTGSFLVNLGFIGDRIYRVNANHRLEVAALNTSKMSREVRELQGNIVHLKAMYGRDTDGDQAVDVYDYDTPVTQAAWLNVLAIRLAIVARSTQFEREDVTLQNPLWDVGTAIPVTGSVTCGSSRCVEIPVGSTDANWKRYRYKVFDTVVPLRNQRFRSGN